MAGWGGSHPRRYGLPLKLRFGIFCDHDIPPAGRHRYLPRPDMSPGQFSLDSPKQPGFIPAVGCSLTCVATGSCLSGLVFLSL
ncbi:hypothetical protein PoB_005185800 [Plakobranchus ocellatus]|uniref:Uncharacterized protein n=1 Tax=Plakobranchus ocellatus TaxID=259542 RepID=A0AAV4C1P8_9GAST|nr:hypothetical protein PoB_005185800 [Plakobranchus ocellatus]